MSASKPSGLRPPSARVAVDAARVDAWEPSAPRGASIPSPVRMVRREGAEWRGALSFIGLALGLVPLLFLGLWFLGVGDKTADHALGDDYVELLAAGRAPGLFQGAVLFEAMTWLAVAAFIVTAARLADGTGRVSSTFAYGLGVACLIGLAGAFLRLTGTTRIGLDYTVADGAEATALATAYLGILQVSSALNQAGYLVQGMGFILAGTGLWNLRTVPAGLGGWITVPGFTGLLSWVVAVAANNRPPLGLLVGPMVVIHLLVVSAVGFVAFARMRTK